MGKKISFSLLILLLLTFFTACSGSTSTAANQNQSTAQNITQYGAPERRFELQGQVKSIRGNEITVYKVIGEELELTEAEKAKRQQEMQSLSPEERQKSRDDRIKVSEETQVFIVPVGVPIITTQNVGGKLEVQKLDLANIKKGSQLKIWFKADSQNGEAEFIQLMNSGGI